MPPRNPKRTPVSTKGTDHKAWLFPLFILAPTSYIQIHYPCVNALYKSFVQEKILLRGAICRGDLFHSGNIVFGPAMVKAHEAEENIAIYPRIILLPDLQEDFFFNCPEMEKEFFTDYDGIRCFDWLVEVVFHSKYEAKQERLYVIQELVSEYTKPSVSPRIQQKYLWLKNHFNPSLILLDQLDKGFSQKDKGDCQNRRASSQHVKANL